MLTKLATFIDANRRRGAAARGARRAIAGAFGFGVAKHMSPYGADGPGDAIGPGRKPLRGRARAARSTRGSSRS